MDTRIGEEIAIKKVAPVFQDLIDTRRLAREVRVLRTLAHPCIIKISDLVPPVNTVDFRELYVRAMFRCIETGIFVFEAPACHFATLTRLWCFCVCRSEEHTSDLQSL